MLKKLLILAFAGLLSPAYAAGTIPFSFYPQVDLQGRVMPGCKFYTIQAGTVSTPQNAYQDSALTLPLPNPQTCDASGRLPQMFLADGQIKIRLTTSAGVNVLTADNVLVIGPSGGGGGGGSVDPTTIIATGDLKCRYGTGVLTGFVRSNGRTIGSATSGATERANADTKALFEYLWQTDANLTVSTGRGASANADWVANKTLTLPDGRGRVWAMPDGMGNTSAGRLANTFGASNDTLGAVYGIDTFTLLRSALPNLVLTFTGNQIAGLRGNLAFQPLAQAGALGQPGGGPMQNGQSASAVSAVEVDPFTPSGSISNLNGGVGQTSVPQLGPTILAPCFLKL